MSLLATVATRLGRVELHCERGVFTTRGVTRIPDLIGSGHDWGEGNPTIILITPERAREWHELAENTGHVYLPFPQSEAVAG